MAFGIHMIDTNGKQRPPCTQLEIEMDWETLIRPKDKQFRIPYLILIFGIIFTTLLFVIAIKIRHQGISLVMPLNQPRDLANLFLALLIILPLTNYAIKQ